MTNFPSWQLWIWRALNPLAVFVGSIIILKGMRRMPARPHCETGHSSVNKSNPFFFIAGIELVDGRFQFNKGEVSCVPFHPQDLKFSSAKPRG